MKRAVFTVVAVLSIATACADVVLAEDILNVPTANQQKGGGGQACRHQP
jgi:hypothetical protein